MFELNGLRELDDLATDFVNQLRDGNKISVEEFAALHPDNSEAITQYFPAIASIESLRSANQSANRFDLDTHRIARQQLGDFRIVREIGRGGMGVVFLAQQVSLGRQIALKVLPPGFVAEPKYSRRFEREARIAANLHHTNIVPVFGVGRDQGTLYIAMQYIDGVGLDRLIEHAGSIEHSTPETFCLKASFEQLIREKKSQTDSSSIESGPSTIEPAFKKPAVDVDLSRSVAEIGLQAAHALQFAHEQGVLHRDVTPGNLLLDQQGKLWVADFGLASAVNYENITETGAVMGTLNYMAPEQYCDGGDVRSDVYSLGMTLFELATLKRARNAKEFFKCVAESRLPQPVPSLRKLNSRIHRDLESIIVRAIESNPEQRYQSARELGIDLKCFLNGEPLKTKPPNSIERLWRWTHRNPFAAFASAVAASLMILMTVMSTFGYVRELSHRAQHETLTMIATDALDQIYAQLAPRNLPQDLPAISTGSSPISSYDVVQMPSKDSFAILEKLQDHYERVSEFSFDTTIKLKAADAKNRIGQINIYLGKLAAAEHAFVCAAEMCVEILRTEHPPNDPVHDNAIVLLAATWNQLGYVYRGQFSDSLSVDAHNRAFECLQSPSDRLAAQTSYQFELARTLYSQDISSTGDSFNADMRSRTQQALKILERLQPGGDDSEILLLQARCYRRLSEQLGTLPNRYDGESIRIMRQLIERYPAIPQYKFELGYCLAGNHVVEVRDESEYFVRIQEAISIAESLVETSPNVPKHMQLAVLANEKHATYYRNNNEPKTAARFTEKAIRLQKSLLKRFPQLVAQHRVFLFALRLEGTNLMVEQRDYEQARSELEEITKSVEELVRNPKLANDWHALRVLTASFDSLARISDRLEDSVVAAVARAKADLYRERLYKISS